MDRPMPPAAGVVLLVALLAVPLGVSPLAAAPAAARLSATDLFNLEYALDPQVSPDGKRVVYVRQFFDIKTDRRYSNFWVAGADGSDHQPLTGGNQGDASPRWSPDGGRIAFISDRGGSPQIHVRWMDSGQIARITNLEFPPGNIVWSPDGRQIAFTALVRGKPPVIAEMPEAPKGAEWAEPVQVIDRMVYRFDKAGYLPHGFVHLFTVPADGGTPRQISSGDFHHGSVGFFSPAPVWTPDGKALILAANRRPDWEHEPLDSDIHEFPLDGGPPRALTDRRGPDYAPAISPDGNRIAYVGFDDRYQGYQVTRLHVAERDGGGARILLPGLDRDVEDPRWAPDGSGIYFTYSDQGNTKLAFATLAGEHRVLARDLGTGGSAYGSGVSYSVGPGGIAAFTCTRPRLPGDIAVITASDPEARLVTAVNEDLLSQRELGEVEEIRYRSSRDGREIHGWIIKPPGFDPARKYPLILEIHGGPFADYGPRFDAEKQIWAARDFVVLYTNPRGSTSYGEEFGNLIHHAYPGDDFFDLDAGVDAVIEKGYIDKDNLFVTGGSGGGVLTCWMIGRSDRFRAAATAYPVINWVSWVLSADIPAFGVKYWFPGPPWEHAEHYVKRSLLSVVGNVKTPTLVITGEEDYRTPMSESEQYYTALKLRRIDAVLVRVPGEPHGLRNRTSHHVAKVLNIIAWFERHLKK